VSESALLHVTNGDSAAITLGQTRIGGAVLAWQDALHDGPVPALARPKLLRLRAAFLSVCGWGSELAIATALERRDRQLVEALEARAEVVFWFEHDLYDQLQLLDALTLARERDAVPSLIVVDSFPGRPSFHGLGELTSDELETLWPSRRPPAEGVLDVAAEVWAAFRAPEPTALAAWSNRPLSELPLLRNALRRLLEELPGAGDGLSRTERQALKVIAAGATSPESAFLAAQRLEAAPFLGDAWFHRTLAAVGSGSVRLIETGDGEPLPPPPPIGDHKTFSQLELRLTGDGQRVLDRYADRVDLLGLDRWIGGTHLTPHTAWRWDATTEDLVEPNA
jgi:hypothetical protein